MASFSDLLKGVNTRIGGYNAEDPTRVNNLSDWKLSFSAKPQKHISLDAERNMESKADKDGARSNVDKTSNKLKIEHECGLATTWTFANDKMAFDAKVKVYNEDGIKVNAGAAAENKPEKKEWKVTGSADVSSNDVGGAKVAMAVSAEFDHKQKMTVKPKINIEIADEFNLGVSVVKDGDVKQDIFPQFIYNPKDKASFYWARADLARTQFMVGCDQKLKDSINHSFEAIYGYGKDKQALDGLYGYPIDLRTGVNYTLSNKTTVNSAAVLSKDWQVNCTVQHSIDSNWTVAATQSYNGAYAEKNNAYHIGFSAAYKL